MNEKFSIDYYIEDMDTILKNHGFWSTFKLLCFCWFSKYKKCKTKSDIIVRYCRTHGVKYQNLNRTKVAFKEFKGTMTVKTEEESNG